MGRTTFEASVHGFHFSNYDIRWRYGMANGTKLCGGLSFGSLDHFYYRLPVPTSWGAPEEGTPLHDYIVARQMDAHHFAIPRLIRGDGRWRNNPFQASLRADQNFGIVKRMIDSGRPLPILLSSRGASLSTNSHWVVATGYEMTPTSALRKLYLYDSNRPNVESELVPDFQNQTFQIRGGRGIFSYYAPFDAYQAVNPQETQRPRSITNIATNPLNLRM